MPSANHDTDKLELFTGNERTLVCIGAFVVTFFIHFWFQSLLEKPIQGLSDYVFAGPKIEVFMQGRVPIAIIAVCAASIPSAISTALVFGLSHVKGLRLGRAVLIWLAVVIAVSVAWGIVAGRYRLV
jgi:hypothetical protein